ncbi:MAG: RND family efflux transporter MFP subunit [Rhodothermales bacterium]
MLVGGFAISGVLESLRAEPPREIPPSRAPLVETQRVSQTSGSLTVSGTGTVRPTREIVLAAQVGGRIESVSPAFKTGGAFSRGQVLARIEEADYQNAVAVARAEVTQRKYELLRADEEVLLARDEWNRAAARSGESALPDSTELGRLAFREPQRELARAALRASEARLRDAELRAGRTRIIAPFSGRVQSKQVDLGQFVAPGQGIANFYSTDAVEVSVQMTREQMDLIEPSWQVTRPIAAAVSTNISGRPISWTGYVDRIEGTLDPSTRQVSAVVRVSRPYDSADGRPPLLVGSFVDVAMEGINLDRYFEIPRNALRDRDGGQPGIWVLDGTRLVMQPVDVVQRAEDVAIITSESLGAAFDLITSELLVVTDGMTVRTGAAQ